MGNLDPLLRTRALFDAEDDYAQAEAERRKKAAEKEAEAQAKKGGPDPLKETVVLRNLVHTCRPWVPHPATEPYRAPQHYSQPGTFNSRTVYPVHRPTAAGVHVARDLAWGTSYLPLLPMDLATPVSFKDRRASLSMMGFSHYVLEVNGEYVGDYPTPARKKAAATISRSEIGQILALLVRRVAVPPQLLTEEQADNLEKYYIGVAKQLVKTIKKRAEIEKVETPL